MSDKIAAVRGKAARAGLFASMVLPSLDVLHKYGTWAGLGAYVVGAAAWVWLMVPRLVTYLDRRDVPSWLSVAAIAVATIGLTLAFVVGHPLADGTTSGSGTDRDEALDIAIARLIRGEHPYKAETYLHNPISPLPGALLLGMPFRLTLGSVAAQNLLWTIGLFVLLLYASRRASLGLVLWASFLLTPEVFREVVTGDDLVTNAVYVSVATAVLVRVVDVTSNRWALVTASVAWGLCLCSRPNYLVLAPIVTIFVVQRAGVRTAFLALAPAGITWTLLTVPLYLADPPAFSPLHVTGKLSAGGPKSVAVVEGLLVVAAAFFVAWRTRPRTEAQVFLATATVLALPVGLVALNILLGIGRAAGWESDFFLPASVFLLAGLAFAARPTERASRTAGAVDALSRRGESSYGPAPP